MVGLVALLSAAFAVACDGGDDTDGEQTAAPTASDGSAEEPDDAEGALHISLTEWAITGEDGAPVPTATAGEVALEVHSDGETPHELAVIATDSDPGTLPEDSGLVDEDAAGGLVDRTSQIAVGEVEVLNVDLDAGSYALICNIAGHYSQGMYASLTVE
jgi:uncharacterized cupredoxin-like copper-binding protein